MNAPNVRYFSIQCNKNERKIQIFTKKCTFAVHYPPQRHKNNTTETSHTQYTAYQKHPNLTPFAYEYRH